MIKDFISVKNHLPLCDSKREKCCSRKLYCIPGTDESGRFRAKNQDYRVLKFTKLGPFLTSEKNKENPGGIQKPCLVIQTYSRGGILLMQRLCGNSYGIIPSQVSISPALSISIFYPSFPDCLLVCFLTQAYIG